MLATSQMFCAHMGWADMASVAPIAENAALAAIRADGDDPWAHLAMGWVHCLRAASTIPWPSLSWRCASIRISHSRKAITVSLCPTVGAGRKPLRRRAAPCAQARAIRFWRSIMASPLRRSSSDATTTRRCGLRARPCPSARILSARIGCWPLPLPWLAKPRLPLPRSGSFAAPSPTSPWAGSRRKCRSNWKPSVSTTSKASVEQGGLASASDDVDNAMTIDPRNGGGLHIRDELHDVLRRDRHVRFTCAP